MSTKICVIHDTFIYKGGAERLVFLLSKALDSDLVSGFFSKGSFDLRQLGFKNKLIEVSKKIDNKLFKILKLKYDFAFKTKFLKEYDIVVFSGDCLEAVRNCDKNTKKYYYCHTPPRYLFDQKKEYLAKVPMIFKPAFLIISFFLSKIYFKNLSKFDKIFTNSTNTKNRLKAFTGFDSEIIYPPVDTSFFTPSEIRGDYYLSFARLSSIKRVDKIVEAFSQITDKKLKLIYGINDPEKDKILNFIKNYPNIEAICSPEDNDLKKIISESIATIYIPVDEDFGMSPIESMGAGVPVIGVDDGGLRESIIDGKTGILIPKEANIEDLKKAVISLDLDKSLSMKEDCIKRAGDFSLEKFEEKIREKINI